jgi:hypothetical protein
MNDPGDYCEMIAPIGRMDRECDRFVRESKASVDSENWNSMGVTHEHPLQHPVLLPFGIITFL